MAVVKPRQRSASTRERLDRRNGLDEELERRPDPEPGARPSPQFTPLASPLLTTRVLFALQRTGGNRATARLIQASHERLQRQDEGEETEREISLPDGAPQHAEESHGPCDCLLCTGRRDAREQHITSGHASAQAIQRRAEADVQQPGTISRAFGSKKPKPPPTDYKIRLGNVAVEFRNPEDLSVSPFGEEQFSCAHRNATAKVKGASATINFTIALNCRWGVNGGGNIDVSSASDSVVTTATHASGLKVYEQIAEDLTPRSGDNWRPRRDYYWSRNLTRRHERYHSLMDKSWGRGAGKRVVTKYLKGKTISVANTLADLTALLDAAMGEMSVANFDWYSGGGKAYIDRPGEKAAFAEGRHAYKTLASGVKRRGKRLEAAERKAAKKAGKTGSP